MRRHRVGLDARMDKPWMTGLGRYARSLVLALTGMGERTFRWVIIKHPSMAGHTFAAPGSDAEEVVVPGDLDTWENLFAGPAIGRLGLDLYHALENFIPPGIRVPRVVVTTHDLVWIEQPGLTARGRLDFLRTPVVHGYGLVAMRHAFRRSSAVIAVSEATRQAALRCFPFLEPDRVTVVHNGVDPDLFPPRGDGEPEEPFLLVLGNSRPYKNVTAALGAFARLDHPAARLVLAGRGDWFRPLRRMARRLGVLDRVDFRTRPQDGEVLALLYGARALVFPSLVEGFGLPLVEAMSAGCPVLASAVPVVEEICADAASYFDPRDEEDIARVMGAALASRELRLELRRRGLRRAREFDWKRCAERTLEVYRRVLR